MSDNYYQFVNIHKPDTVIGLQVMRLDNPKTELGIIWLDRDKGVTFQGTGKWTAEEMRMISDKMNWEEDIINNKKKSKVLTEHG